MTHEMSGIASHPKPIAPSAEMEAQLRDEARDRFMGAAIRFAGLDLHRRAFRVKDRPDSSMRRDWVHRLRTLSDAEIRTAIQPYDLPRHLIEDALLGLNHLRASDIERMQSEVGVIGHESANEVFLGRIRRRLETDEAAAAVKRSASLSNLMVQEVDLAPQSIMTAEQQARACGLDIAVSNRIEGTDTFGRAEDFARFILSGERPDPFAGVRDCPG